MNLYDAVIESTREGLAAHPVRNLSTGEPQTWPTLARNELLLQKETKYELGGSMRPASCFTCVTSSEGLVDEGVFLYGKDLPELKKDAPFGKIVLLKIRALEPGEEAYHTIKDLEAIKFKTILEGFMVRASTMSRKEQVRVSKKALKAGLSFARVGRTYAEAYKDHPLVEAVQVIFITEELPVFSQMARDAKKIDDITFAMNHVLSSIDMDCGSCGLQEICEEVEGLRELHFHQTEKRNR